MFPLIILLKFLPQRFSNIFQRGASLWLMVASLDDETIPEKELLLKERMEQFLSFTNYCISSVVRQSFFIPKQFQNLDPSYKMVLDLWDCLGRVKLVL